MEFCLEGLPSEKIRRYIIEEQNYLDAVIGLPANLFFGTSIPACILVLKKDRAENKDNIFFIDASKEFESGENQNRLRKEDINKIADTYIKREKMSGKNMPTKLLWTKLLKMTST